MKKHLSIILSLIMMMISFQSYSYVKLSSFPSAKATIFLDFDGQTVVGTAWNSNGPLYCAPSGMTDSQITEIFNRVSEDYRPFNINITTDSTVYLTAPLNQRMRVIITPTSDWYQGVGGVAFTGSFIWGDETPAFVFSDRLSYNPKMVAECCTHESGHTVGLSHQAKYNGTCTLLATYNQGTGTGQTSWAPVMGNSYYRNLSGWNNGPTPSGCTDDQDNLSIITSRNGFTYRTDDYSDDPKVNPAQISVVNTLFSDNGIITTNTDKDAFEINLPQDGVLQFNVAPYSIGPNNEGADLDVKVTMLNSSMDVLKIYDPEDKLDVSVDTVLMAGNYYFIVQGAGNANTTNYGSLGSYRVSGTLSPLTVLPINKVLLSGDTKAGEHDLSWSIISDAPLQSLSIESSFDGSIFTNLISLAPGAKSFNYVPIGNEIIFYRLKATSISGQVVYSNIISLKPAENINSMFTISSLVHSAITVNASQNYNYCIADMSGRIIKSGNATAGRTNIDISNSPDGIYVLQIISNSQKTTQRIVKL
jgi:hypothetical protein